jgi:hypothetical protein
VSARFSDLPKRVQRLPADRRGFPIPWFVAWRDGEPQFPVIDAAKLRVAWTNELCWVCGDRLGTVRGWVMGPMSAIEGATPEPPSHYDCARFSVRHCPHLSTPKAKPSTKHGEGAGYGARANVSKVRSGVTAIWMTRGRGAAPFAAGGGILFGLDGPERLEWYAAGGPASAWTSARQSPSSCPPCGAPLYGKGAWPSSSGGYSGWNAGRQPSATTKASARQGRASAPAARRRRLCRV